MAGMLPPAAFCRASVCMGVTPAFAGPAGAQVIMCLCDFTADVLELCEQHGMISSSRGGLLAGGGIDFS